MAEGEVTDVEEHEATEVEKREAKRSKKTAGKSNQKFQYHPLRRTGHGHLFIFKQ